MQRSACAICPKGFSRFRVTLLVTFALFVLCAPPAVVYGQTGGSAMAQSMAAMVEMPEEDRRESMKAAALRGGTCGMDTASNHSLDLPDICTRENFLLWQTHFETCNCIPRETVISLHDATTPNILKPSVVVVNRCGGHCDSMGHTCMATHTSSKAVTLIQYDLYNRMQCGAIRVTEDTQCACSCPLTAEDCNEQQVFRPNLCLCQCKKTAEFLRGCDSGRRWDGRRCRCVCKAQRECSTGYGWSSEYCRCLMMMIPPVDEIIPSADSDNSFRY